MPDKEEVVLSDCCNKPVVLIDRLTNEWVCSHCNGYDAEMSQRTYTINVELNPRKV